MKQDILKYASRLEFEKICAEISELAVCEAAKEAVINTKPKTELWEAEQLLELTDELFVMLSRNSSPSISPVSGIYETVLRCEKGGVLSMSELLSVCTMLHSSHNLKAWYSGGDDDGGMQADRLFYMLYEDAELERSIGDSILSETEMSDDASPALRDIRRKIANTENSIRDKLDSIIRSSTSQKYLQDAVVTMRGGRFVVPVKQEFKGEVKGIVHDVSSSGSTYFVEPAAVAEANNRIMQLKGEELREMDRILSVLSGRVAAVAETLRQSYGAFIEIDAALAKAKYSMSIDATRPILNDTGVVSLKKARHPLIPKKNVVPIDVALGDEFTSLVITGPNTGGKTVTLKTVGLLTLMAMSGILVPAGEHSELCVFEQILVDIGDEQSIEQSLSTFSGHIKNTAAILETADERSLVLLDELGAGTDPAEGASLATAILDRLRSLGCRVIATTHYGELKLYALDTDGVQNASCEFDVETLRPTYRLVMGIPGRSNALLIGEKLGLDSALIESARRNMSAEERRFEDVLDEMERLKSDISRREREIEQQRIEVEESAKIAKKEHERLVAQGRREMEAAKLKAKQLAGDVAMNANRLLDEIRKLEKEKQNDTLAARRRAKTIADTDSAKLFDLGGGEINADADNLEPLDEVKQGDAVYVVALAQLGEALSAADDKGNVEIKAGSIKTRVNIKDLRKPKTSAGRKKKAAVPSRITVDRPQNAKTEINLHGMTVDEAELEMDRFIDDAVLSHLNTVVINHGKGTGALRRGVHIFLKRHKHVKHFRLGQYGEGGDGVTVVELNR